MSLVVRSFADKGNLEKERIVLRAMEEVEIGHYTLLRSDSTTEGAAISGSKDAYWFPNKKVKKDDLVILYTKKGTPSTKSLASGATAHFYYWRHASAFWGEDKKNVAVLLFAPTWKTSNPAPTKSEG